jgi:hypothetical protein
MSWYPDTCTGAVNRARTTQYRFDDALLNGPSLHSASHPSHIVFNQWSNTDKKWSAGPPVKDATIIIKSVVVYYDKPSKIGEGACPIRGACDPSVACKVNL